MIVRAANRLQQQRAATPAPPAPSKEEVLLAEIRDAIRAQR